MDLRALGQARFQSLAKSSLLSEIFSASPLLQHLRPTSSADGEQRTEHPPQLQPQPQPQPQAQRINSRDSSESEQDRAEDVEERQQQQQPAAKRQRVGEASSSSASSGNRSSQAAAGGRRYVEIAAALVPRQAPEEPPKRKVLPRSKAGCYTCRKRRVKCDQARPVCRRCLKARRACTGYDPNVEPEPPIAIPSLDERPSIPKGGGRGRRRASIPAAPGTATAPRPAGATPPMNGNDGAHFGAHLVDADMDIEFTDSLDAIAVDPALASPSDPTIPATTTTTSRQKDPAAPLTMAALCKVGGEDPPRPVPHAAPPLPRATLDEIKALYAREYAAGIDAFLECSWYAQHGAAYLLDDAGLLAQFAELLQLFAETTPEQYDRMRYLPSAESQLVWALMRLARAVPAPLAAQSPELQVVLNRLAVVEHLVTARRLPTPPPSPSVLARTSHLAHPTRLAFWKYLNQFVGQRRSSDGTAAASPTSADGANDNGNGNGDGAESAEPWTRADARATLAKMRGALAETENRDVLYSIAVVQHFGAPPPPAEEADLQKLKVARAFLEDEAAGAGTTQVVQRLCGMAVRSWSARAA